MFFADIVPNLNLLRRFFLPVLGRDSQEYFSFKLVGNSVPTKEKFKGVLNRKCRYRNRPISAKAETFRSQIGNSDSRGTKSATGALEIADLVPKTYPDRQNRVWGVLDRQDTHFKIISITEY